MRHGKTNKPDYYWAWYLTALLAIAIPLGIFAERREGGYTPDPKRAPAAYGNTVKQPVNTQATQNAQVSTPPSAYLDQLSQQDAARQERVSEYRAQRDALVQQIKDNETQQATLHVDISSGELALKYLEGSGVSVLDQSYTDAFKAVQAKRGDLVNTLQERLQLDDELKELDAEYPDVAGQ